MPSFHHELLVELFRNDGALAVALLYSRAGLAIDHARVELGSIDLSQVAPTEYRADAVIILRDRADHPVAGVIVEVQRQIERGKRLSWPVYVTALRAKLGSAVVLLVVAPDPDVAAWARQPIELGHPGFQLTPIVVGFDDVPWIRDRGEACRLPELAVLSVMAHPQLEIAEVAIDAVTQLPGERGRLYLDVIMMALPAALRQTLEARMLNYEYRSEFARKYYGQGREEGRTEGREAGRAEGREDGLRAAVVAIVRAKLDDLSDAELAAIDNLHDQQSLTALITSLTHAVSASEARAVLRQALTP